MSRYDQIMSRLNKKKEGGALAELGLSKSQEKKVTNLPYEIAVYVPSTQDVSGKVSKEVMKQRVDEVQKYLSGIFGGFSSSDVEGGYVTTKQELVKEDIVKVIAFSTKESFNENKHKLVAKISEWSKRWGQEAIGVEIEGDLLYIPIMANGGISNVWRGLSNQPRRPIDWVTIQITEFFYHPVAHRGKWVVVSDNFIIKVPKEVVADKVKFHETILRHPRMRKASADDFKYKVVEQMSEGGEVEKKITNGIKLRLMQTQRLENNPTFFKWANGDIVRIHKLYADNREILTEKLGKPDFHFLGEFRYSVWNVFNNNRHYLIFSAKTKGTNYEIVTDMDLETFREDKKVGEDLIAFGEYMVELLPTPTKKAEGGEVSGWRERKTKEQVQDDLFKSIEEHKKKIPTTISEQQELKLYDKIFFTIDGNKTYFGRLTRKSGETWECSSLNYTYECNPNSITKMLELSRFADEMEEGGVAEKRYATDIDFYQYAKNDEEVIEKAKKVVNDMRDKLDNQAQIVEINETPFASMESRKLENVPKYAEGGNIKLGDNVHIKELNRSGVVTNVNHKIASPYMVKFVDGESMVFKRKELEKLGDESENPEDFDDSGELAKGGGLKKDKLPYNRYSKYNRYIKIGEAEGIGMNTFIIAIVGTEEEGWNIIEQKEDWEKEQNIYWVYPSKTQKNKFIITEEWQGIYLAQGGDIKELQKENPSLFSLAKSGEIKIKTPRKEYTLEVGDVSAEKATEIVKEKYPNFTEFEYKRIQYKKRGKKGEFLTRIEPQETLEARWKKKKERIRTLSDNIGKLRNNVSRDLKSDDEKVFLSALVVAIMDKTGERVGNNESAENGHYGVTGFRKKHISVKASKVVFDYVGKSGVSHEKMFVDENIAKGLKKAISKSPNYFVFATSEGQKIGANHINEYLDKFGITAKDIRGYSANKWILDKLKDIKPEDTDKKRKKQFNIVLKQVASQIGHGSATLRKHYMMPEVSESWIEKGEVFNIKKAGYVLKKGGSIKKETKMGNGGKYEYLEEDKEVQRQYEEEQLKEGVKVEQEHKDLYDKLKKRLSAKRIAMPITEKEFYETIAKAHLKEDDAYYILLKKCVEKKQVDDLPFHKQGPLAKGGSVEDEKEEDDDKVDEDDDYELKKGGKTKAEKYKIAYLNKNKNHQRDEKIFDSYEQAEKWGEKNLDNFDQDMIRMVRSEGGELAKGGNVGGQKFEDEYQDENGTHLIDIIYTYEVVSNAPYEGKTTQVDVLKTTILDWSEGKDDWENEREVVFEELSENFQKTMIEKIQEQVKPIDIRNPEYSKYAKGGKTKEEMFTIAVTKTTDNVTLRSLQARGYEPQLEKLDKEYYRIVIPMRNKKRYQTMGLEDKSREVRNYAKGGQAGVREIVFTKKVNPQVSVIVKVQGSRIIEIINERKVHFPFHKGQMYQMNVQEWARVNGYSMDGKDLSREEKIFGVRVSDVPQGHEWRMIYPNKFRAEGGLTNLDIEIIEKRMNVLQNKIRDINLEFSQRGTTPKELNERARLYELLNPLIDKYNKIPKEKLLAFHKENPEMAKGGMTDKEISDLMKKKGTEFQKEVEEGVKFGKIRRYAQEDTDQSGLVDTDYEIIKELEDELAREKRAKGGTTGMNVDNCERCGKPTSGHTIMSMFNEDIICMACKEEERKHPDYKKATDAELEALKGGNGNFKGIGYEKKAEGGEVEEYGIKYDELRQLKKHLGDLFVRIANQYRNHHKDGSGNFGYFMRTIGEGKVYDLNGKYMPDGTIRAMSLTSDGWSNRYPVKYKTLDDLVQSIRDAVGKGGMAKGGLTNEDIITKYNLYGKGIPVRFKNDKKIYFTKNIHPNRTNIFVTESGGQVRYKKLSDISVIGGKVVKFANGGGVGKNDISRKDKITHKGDEGGMLDGPSHAEGGIKTFVRSNDDYVEVEGGESIINKHAMAMKEKVVCEGTPAGVASAVNQLAGNGVKFADDGKCKIVKK